MSSAKAKAARRAPGEARLDSTGEVGVPMGRRPGRLLSLLGVPASLFKLEGLALEDLHYLLAGDGVEEIDQVDVQQVELAGVLAGVGDYVAAVVVV